MSKTTNETPADTMEELLEEAITGVTDIPVGLEAKLTAVALNAVVELARLEIVNSDETLKIKLQAANLLLNFTMAQEAKELEKAKIEALRNSPGFPTDGVSAIPFTGPGVPGFYPTSE